MAILKEIAEDQGPVLQLEKQGIVLFM